MKKPDLKYRYAMGLGDIIACTLHSKPIGWLVHFITGNKEPCQACSQRAIALNILFPIPMWRLSFKNLEDRDKALIQDFKNSGFKMVGFDDEIEEIKNKPPEMVVETKTTNDDSFKNIEDQSKKFSDLKLITTNDMILDPYIIKIKIYKKI